MLITRSDDGYFGRVAVRFTHRSSGFKPLMQKPRPDWKPTPRIRFLEAELRKETFPSRSL